MLLDQNTWRRVIINAISSDIQLNIESLLLYASSLKTTKVNLKVSTIETPPFTYFMKNVLNVRLQECSVGKLCWKEEFTNKTMKRIPYCCIGYSIDLLILLEKELGISTDINIASAYGSNENGTWSGMIGDLIRGDTDISLYVSMTLARSKVVDFSEPYLNDDLVLVSYAEEEEMPLFNMEVFASLSGLLWLSIFATIFVASFILILTERVRQRLERPHTSWKYTWTESISYLTGLLFQRDIGGMNPDHSGSRILSLSIAIAMMVMMSTYTAVLTANSVSVHSRITLTGFRDPKVRYRS